ncbi:sialyltransferase [Chloropicon primus]|nr:sialyltransferase [Chloropicon primus]
MRKSSTKRKGSKSRLFVTMLCALATVLIIAPPTPMELHMQNRVIYISNKQSSQLTPPDAAGQVVPAAADSAAAMSDEVGKGAGSDQLPSSDGGDADEDKEDAEPGAASGYKRCPRTMAPVRPTLEGLSLDFRVGRHGFNISDSFIHKGNYEQLLRGDYTLHRHTIPMLPKSYEDIAANYKFNSCAVVGSSGYMKLAQFGAAIDTHDVVVRLNQSPTKAFAKWVGTKTTMRMLNSLWSNHYGAGRYEPMALPLENDVTLIVSRTTGHAFDKIVKTMKQKRPDVKVLQLSSRVVSAARRLLVRYRVKLCKDGYGPYSGGSTPSSGFVAVYFLRTICKRVTLYGLGTVNIPDVPYHYFTGVGSRQKGNSVHSFDSESATLDALAFEDKIEQCKYRTRDIVPHGNQILSNLRTNFTLLQDHRYNNRFCGWNLCNRRGYKKLGEMVGVAREINYADCRKIMYNE